jgi:3-aminobutyryl-CoA ammonia-lyase
MEKSMIRLRMSAKDAHYGGNLVDGAHMVHLFGDVATELLIMHDGDEGLFVAYDNVEFLAPVYAGDYIEAVGEIVKVGNTSRKMVFEARTPRHLALCGRRTQRARRGLPCQRHVRRKKRGPAHP